MLAFSDARGPGTASGAAAGSPRGTLGARHGRLRWVPHGEACPPGRRGYLARARAGLHALALTLLPPLARTLARLLERPLARADGGREREAGTRARRAAGQVAQGGLDRLGLWDLASEVDLEYDRLEPRLRGCSKGRLAGGSKVGGGRA